MDIDLDRLNWQKLVAPYAKADLRQAIWQLVNTVLPFVVLWSAMLWSVTTTSVRIPYWVTLLLAIPTAGFMVRTFIIFHDCCHGSFFKSKKANEAVGIVLGILTFTPFYQWRHDHAIHHATAGNIDKRNVGDVPTMTVREYLAAPWYTRAGYRILRFPLILFTVGSAIMFLVVHRFPPRHAEGRERLSVHLTNLGVLAFYGGLALIFGWKAVLAVLLPVALLACTAGVWLFYVQHQFEGVYWEMKDRWSFVRAGLQGSSFYRLPRVLQWFTGNIGFHHIHHLSPKIPNYRLEQCYRQTPAFQVRPLTLLASLRGVRLHLIDEATRQLVGWDVLRKYR
ncbi:MAG: Fatty acid desaturase [Chloroflexi bacterium ADurb.Bin325]|nr:MAG: Fatty acid desaturase [Chloroflexi bacterium ADurb.Bin325]